MSEAECPCGFFAQAETAEGVATIVGAHKCPPAPQRRWWDAIDCELAIVILAPTVLIALAIVATAITGHWS